MLMAVVLVKDKVSLSDIQKASEDYQNYIKIAVDIQASRVTIGGAWHADGERLLLQTGSSQDAIWGGGIDMETKKIETVALINIRPKFDNDSQEILDSEIRNKFIEIVQHKFGING
jgi:hypothetical protein